MVARLAAPARNSGSRTNRPTASATVNRSVAAMVPLPSSWPSPAAWTEPERISQRVPMTSVS